MQTIGELIKHNREEQKKLLREVAAGIDIDQGLLSKIERGDRLPTKQQVVKLAQFFKVEENIFVLAWLSDKVVNDVEGEDLAKDALKIAEEKILKKKIS